MVQKVFLRQDKYYFVEHLSEENLLLLSHPMSLHLLGHIK